MNYESEMNVYIVIYQNLFADENRLLKEKTAQLEKESVYTIEVWQFSKELVERNSWVTESTFHILLIN